jgi:acyl carrier protein
MKIEINEFEKKLKEDLEINFKLGIKENFLENKKWDSLLNMGLLAHLDSEYNIIFEYDDLLKLNSIFKIYNEIIKRN